jgi:hypothetical protein
MIKWLIGLATIAALASFPTAIDDTDTRPPTLSSPSTDELPLTAKPAIGKNRPFSVAEIRWCMSQYIWLQTAQPRLATRRAVDRYNELAGDYNRRCNGYRYRESEREQARQDIAGARRQIVAAALEDIHQLSDGGARTRRAQELLEVLGYNPGVIDGVYGTQTKAAIEAFQREAGILVDGLLSEELLQHLTVTLARHRTGRSGREKAATGVVILVVEATGGAVSDAEVRVSGDGGFHDDQLTNERGRVEFAAVPAGKLEVDVRRNGDRYRYTFQSWITEEPHQELLITLPSDR